MAQAPSSATVNQVAKGMAILAVIFLHFLSTFFPDQIYQSGLNGLFFITLNQICRFSVPLFIGLSGYGLAKKYGHLASNRLSFYRHQLKKILPAYLFWSLFFIFTLRIYQPGFSLKQIWSDLFLGLADYHLYFVPLIIQLYLIYPFLSKLLTKFNWSLLVLFFAIQLIYFVLLRLLTADLPYQSFLSSDQFQYRQLINWLFYFVFGLFLSQIDLVTLSKNRLTKPIIILFITIGLVISIADSYYLIATRQSIIYATSFSRPSVFIYSLAIISLFIIYGQSLLKYLRPYLLLLSFFGRHSYIIYLSHPLFLRFLQSLASGQVGQSAYLGQSAILVVSFLIKAYFFPLKVG